MTDNRIRPFEGRDYSGIVAVWNAIYTDYPRSVDEARHEDARYDGTRLLLRRFVAEEPGGRLAGHGSYHHAPNMYHPQKFYVDVLVHPASQRRGLGTRLYDHLITELLPHHPVTLWTGLRETFPHSIRSVERRGFHEIRRAWESRLDVAAFDPASFEPKAAAAVRGMSIVMVADERERDPQWLPKLYELHTEVAADVPRSEPYTRPTMEEFNHRMLDNPGYLADGHFLAKDGDRYVAESNLFRSHELPQILHQGITGTRRAYRGRGLALALKLQTIAYARARGFREIRTWNDTTNAPMLAINTKLGFVRQPAWIFYERGAP